MALASPVHMRDPRAWSDFVFYFTFALTFTSINMALCFQYFLVLFCLKSIDARIASAHLLALPRPLDPELSALSFLALYLFSPLLYLFGRRSLPILKNLRGFPEAPAPRVY